MNVIPKPDFSFSFHVTKRQIASNRSVNQPLIKHCLRLSLVQTASCATGVKHLCTESMDPFPIFTPVSFTNWNTWCHLCVPRKYRLVTTEMTGVCVCACVCVRVSVCVCVLDKHTDISSNKHEEQGDLKEI